ncbi:MAG: ABC transporter ATP-binding protein/permease [Lachnospiraceae bacterium]|nr:ABC transporter ATP-binding protein/permease [Lachnospiraceae bacterium]
MNDIRKLKKNLMRILSYIGKHHGKEITVVVIAILVSVGAGLMGNMFMRVVIDDYILEMLATGEEMFDKLLRFLLLMAVVYAVGVAATWLYNRTMAVVAQASLKEIRDEMFCKMQKLPVRFFDTHNHGDVMSIYTNDTDTLRQLIAQSLPMLVSSLINIVLTLLVMNRYSNPLTRVVLVVAVVMVLVSVKLVRFSGRNFFKQQGTIGRVNGYIEEMLNGQKVVKVFCHEKAAQEKFEEMNGELCSQATKAGGSSMLLMPVMSAFGNIEYLIVAVIGGAMALSVDKHGQAEMTIGTLVAFLALIRQFASSITQTAQQMNSVIMGLAGAERIFDLMDQKPEMDSGYVTMVRADQHGDTFRESPSGAIWVWKHPHDDGSVTYTKVAGNVVFDHVDFAYEEGHPVLHDISMYAKPGQKLAFVGATGAGKTTMTNLINRFYDLADGKVRYDGVNINKIKKSDLRRSIGMILQDVSLFTGTIMDNIRYGRLEATDEECIEAAKLAGADSFISRLPQGYQTQLCGDGSSLSQGQNQLISIARAAVADPPVMVMDEATSSIDTRTEKTVQEGMDYLMEGRTVFVIAHRLSTVQNANVILVLDHGQIIERGNHEQLIAQRGEYWQLYTGALELE